MGNENSALNSNNVLNSNNALNSNNNEPIKNEPTMDEPIKIKNEPKKIRDPNEYEVGNWAKYNGHKATIIEVKPTSYVIEYENDADSDNDDETTRIEVVKNCSKLTNMFRDCGKCPVNWQCSCQREDIQKNENFDSDLAKVTEESKQEADFLREAGILPAFDDLSLKQN